MIDPIDRIVMISNEVVQPSSESDAMLHSFLCLALFLIKQYCSNDKSPEDGFWRLLTSFGDITCF